MRQQRRAAKVDSNQKEIVEDLEKLGITVDVGHDDILVGYEGVTYWFEIKTGPRAEIKKTQLKLLDNWKGHYEIVWSTQMILNSIGYKHD